MFRYILILLLSFSFITASHSQNKTVIVKIETKYGFMLFKLFNETPLHRDNFIALIKKGHYDSLLFHRVIEGFVVQGGDPKSKYAPKDSLLGEGDVGYTVQREFNAQFFHKKGALAMAREGDDVNPEKASSGCQFYIVKGKARHDTDIVKAHYRINKALIQPYEDSLKNADSIKYKLMKPHDKRLLLTNKTMNKTGYYKISPNQIKTYKTLGGVPHLDNNYTVFGEIIFGMTVLDKLSAVKTDTNDRPINDLRMKISIVDNQNHARKNRKNTK
jgi:peptidylprolyl isomerase